MKHLHNLLTLVALACLTFGMTACNDDDDDPDSIDLVYNFGREAKEYNADGYWAQVLNPEQGPLGYTGVTVSHSVSAFESGGVTTYSWSGFCPSKVSDLKDYTAEGTWVDHQYAAMPGKGFTTPNYLVGYWNSGEKLDGNIATPSCYIKFESEVALLSTRIANTTWGYFAMKNGSAYSKAFGQDDYCNVIIYGRLRGVCVGSIKVPLAYKGKIFDSWIGVDLSGLGTVDELVFQMESSDNSTFNGVSYMNNPAYFCITDLYTRFYKSPIKQ